MKLHSIFLVLSIFAGAIWQHGSLLLADAINADILLQNGILHRGDGAPPTIGHVAIRDARIVATGVFEPGNIEKVIDCQNLVICPGFIDLHNHSDSPILEPATRACTNYVTQGCTTIVTGNCGAGPIDVGDYYDKIESRGVGLNVAHLLPQGRLRREVLRYEDREPSKTEQAKMNKIAEKAMQEGAWGMTTGLIYVPSSFAKTSEIVQIAKVVGRYGGIYASHIRNEGTGLLEAVNEALSIGRQAEVPVHISHYKSSGQDAWGLVRVATESIKTARAAGQIVTADQYPYSASSTSLGATLFPAWSFAGSRDQLLARLKDKVDGKRIRDAITAKLKILDGGQRLQIASYGPNPEWAGKRLAEIAKSEGKTPLELALSMQKAGGAAVVNHSINEQDIRFVMSLPWVATASDGGAKIPNATVPHPRSYGTFPRKLGYYSIRENAVSLEQAIRSSTGLPADILGMKDRGYLRKGQFADIVVFDPEKISDTATFEDPHRYSVGISHVFINGKPVLSHGVPTGVLAGRSLRKPQPSQAADPTRLTQSQIDDIDKIFAEWDAPNSPGCSLGILKNGMPLYQKGYGSANLDHGIPLDADSVFYLASVSKQFVAACVLLLSDDGKISLDDEVQTYINELPDFGKKISIRHLIHHSSGLPDYFSLMQEAGLQIGDLHSNQTLIHLVANCKELEFTPGERYKYSNSGYLLLAEIVHRVSKKTLREFANERIFEPLGMNSTRFHDNHKETVPRRVLSYAMKDSDFELAYLAQWDKVGSGGLLSSVNDLAKWDENLYTGEVGGPSFLEQLTSVGIFNDGSASNYAAGLMHLEHKGRKTIGHGGSFMGFKTVHLRFPSEHFSVIILGNVEHMDPTALAQRVSDICLPEITD